jgi:uncharacterized delta-60 repeat protein
VARYNLDGSVDTTFGAGGTVTVMVVPAAVAVQADSKIVAVGTAGASSGATLPTDFGLLRLNPSGTLDTGFGTGGQVATGFTGTMDSFASGVAVQADGKFVVAGSAGQDLVLARYNLDGSLDATFSTGGKLDLGSGSSNASIAIQPDGKIVVVGPGRVVRLNTDSSLDTTFGMGGMITTVGSGYNFTAPPVFQSDGKILVLGSQLTRLNPDGSLDTGFGMAGNVQVFNGRGVALQADGKILVDNGPTQNGGLAHLTRYNADGSLDTSFGAGGMVAFPGTGSSMAVQPDGKIVLGAPLARFNPDGTIDPFFASGNQTTGLLGIDRVALAADGMIIGTFLESVAVFKPNGTFNVRFGDAGIINPDFSPADFALEPDGSLVLVGTTTASGHTTMTVTRYVTTGSSSLTPNQLLIAQVYPDLLQRPVDPGGLAFWSGLLDRGSSPSQVVQEMQSSQEYHTLEVRNLYRRVLGRFPDDSGSAAWTTFLNQGGTVLQLEAFLLGSGEFFAIHGSDNNQGFLPALYQIVLQRPIDSSGAQSWGQALQTGGLSRQTVAAAVLASIESDRLQVQNLYAQFLHRAADPSGLDTFTTELQQGVPYEQVAGILLSSAEYVARV